MYGRQGLSINHMKENPYLHEAAKVADIPLEAIEPSEAGKRVRKLAVLVVDPGGHVACDKGDRRLICQISSKTV